MKIKVSDATNLQLSWLVAKCVGGYELTPGPRMLAVYDRFDGSGVPSGKFDPTADWAQGGPIIEREKIEFRNRGHLASYSDGPTFYGDTHLIAAMRCYVASKLGNEVEVPEELK